MVLGTCRALDSSHNLKEGPVYHLPIQSTEYYLCVYIILPFNRSRTGSGRSPRNAPVAGGSLSLIYFKGSIFARECFSRASLEHLQYDG